MRPVVVTLPFVVYDWRAAELAFGGVADREGSKNNWGPDRGSDFVYAALQYTF